MISETSWREIPESKGGAHVCTIGGVPSSFVHIPVHRKVLHREKHRFAICELGKCPSSCDSVREEKHVSVSKASWQMEPIALTCNGSASPNVVRLQNE